MITTAGEDVMFAMQSGRLVAVDAATATSTDQRRRPVVAIADGGDVLVLDTSSGEQMLAASDLAEVTAVAARGGWVAVGTADGRVRRFDVGANA